MSSDLVFLNCGYMPRCKAVVDKHFDGYYSLQLMTAGTVELFYDDEFHLLQGTWIWPAHPGPRIRFRRATGCAFWTHRYASFGGKRLNSWLGDGLWPLKPQRITGGKKQVQVFVSLFQEIIKHVGRADALSQRKAANTLENVLLELVDTRKTQAQHQPWLQAVLGDIEGNYAPDYRAIANRVGMAVPTLRRRFLEATGTPIHSYVLQLRMASAREMMSNSDLPIKAIAAQLGYADVYFFARQFRQYVGVPPAAYRKSRQL